MVQPFEVVEKLESYMDQLELAIEGKTDWPTPIDVSGLSLQAIDPKLKSQLRELLMRNEQLAGKVRKRQGDLSKLIERVSKRGSSGPIAVDIRA